MHWAKGSLIAAGVFAGSVALLALAPQSGSTAKADSGQEPSVARQRRMVVRPQIEVFKQVIEGNGAELGVTLRDLDEATAKQQKLAGPSGALVESVRQGGAADKAGIKAGDVITEFDGERVRSVTQLRRLVGDTPPDRRVAIVVMRDGRKADISATLERRSDPKILQGDDAGTENLERHLEDLENGSRRFRFELPEGPGSGPSWQFGPNRQWFGQARGARLGIGIQTLTPQLAEYFGVKDGILVTAVDSDMPASRAGVKAGDVVTSVNGKAVADAEALVRAIREHEEGQPLALGVTRNHKPLTLTVKLASTGGTKPI